MSESRRGHEGSPRAGVSLLWGKVEKIGIGQPGEKVPKLAYWGLSLPTGAGE